MTHVIFWKIEREYYTICVNKQERNRKRANKHLRLEINGLEIEMIIKSSNHQNTTTNLNLPL